MNLPERITSKISPEPNSGCWLWDGSINPRGYGEICGKGRNYRAHRVVFECVNGPIPDGMSIDHRCRNRACVNPDHLRLATNKENVTFRRQKDGTVSGYKGVHLHHDGSWRISVSKDGKQKRKSGFSSAKIAALAYDELATELHGEFACTNKRLGLL